MGPQPLVGEGRTHRAHGRHGQTTIRLLAELVCVPAGSRVQEVEPPGGAGLAALVGLLKCLCIGNVVDHTVKDLHGVAVGDNDGCRSLLLVVARALVVCKAREEFHHDVLGALLALRTRVRRTRVAGIHEAKVLARLQLEDVQLRRNLPIGDAIDEVRGNAHRQTGDVGHVSNDLGHGHLRLLHCGGKALCRLLDDLGRLPGLVERDQDHTGRGQAGVEGLQVAGLCDDRRQGDLLCRHILQAAGNDAVGMLLVCHFPVRRAALVHIVVVRGLRADDPRGALHAVHHVCVVVALRHIGEEGLQDEEAHLGQCRQRLMAVAPLVKVHLADRVCPVDAGKL
mmetsp:Transcript_45974/g.137388  ORF Transcript_45974/g.137388 Transcript_45974/m.137388 type:complete len:339 (-) Transcript_45974:1698-2714(-)